MAFCTKCGRRLADGEICNCEQGGSSFEQYTSNMYQQTNNTQYNNEYTKNANRNVSSIGASNILESILNLIKHPIQEGVEFVNSESNILTACVMVLIQAILSGLFAVVMCIKVQGIFDKVISAMGISSSATQLLQMKTVLKMPILKAFFLTFILSVILTLVITLVFIGINKIIKNDISFIQSIELVSLRSIPVSMMILASCVISFVNVYTGLSVFFMSSTIGFITISVVWSHCFSDCVDKQLYLIIVLVVAFTIVYALLVNLCWSQYLPDVFKLALDNMKSSLKGLGSPTEIIQQILQSM